MIWTLCRPALSTALALTSLTSLLSSFGVSTCNLQLQKGPQPFDCLIGVRSVEDLPIKV